MKMMLIGGGKIGNKNDDYTTFKIDKEIVSMTNKKNPNLIFIGFASNYSDSIYDNIKKNFKSLGCICNNLKKKNLKNNRDLAIKKIKEADIIYISGGDTIKLIEEIEEFDLLNEIKEAYNRDCVICGISAGAIFLVKEGFSDAYILRKESNNYEFVKGINLYPISICPHYNNTERKQELFNLLKNKKREIYALEDDTALKIEDNKIQIIKAKKNSNVIYIRVKDKIHEEIL